MPTCRTALAPLLLAAILALGACAGQEDGPIPDGPVVTAPPPRGDLLQTVAAADNLHTFGQALQQSGLADRLAQGGPYTLFAPSDEAFDRLPAATREALMQPENRSMLATILAYHIVPGEHLTEEFEGRQATLRAIDGKDLTVDGNTGPALVVDDIVHVVDPDLRASNGVVQVIDTVLAPPSPPLSSPTG